MPSKIKDLATIRISKTHAMMFRAEPYKRHKGRLIRKLLDLYFNGDASLAAFKIRFEMEIKNVK
jgi:hypothetical protein